MFDDVAESKNKIKEYQSQLSAINDIGSMDDIQKQSFLLDKQLDTLDKTGNMIWASGLTVSLFSLHLLL